MARPSKKEYMSTVVPTYEGNTAYFTTSIQTGKLLLKKKNSGSTNEIISRGLTLVVGSMSQTYTLSPSGAQQEATYGISIASTTDLDIEFDLGARLETLSLSVVLRFKYDNVHLSGGQNYRISFKYVATYDILKGYDNISISDIRLYLANDGDPSISWNEFVSPICIEKDLSTFTQMATVGLPDSSAVIYAANSSFSEWLPEKVIISSQQRYIRAKFIDLPTLHYVSRQAVRYIDIKNLIETTNPNANYIIPYTSALNLSSTINDNTFGAMVYSKSYGNYSGTVSFVATPSVVSTRAFFYNTSLRTINLNYSDPNRDIQAPPISIIDTSAFSYCIKLKDVSLPDALIKIGNNAFSHCSSLNAITLPSNLLIIDTEAFDSLIWMYNLTIPNSVKYINNRAFHACNRLGSVQLPSNAGLIGKSAFESCALTTLSIPSGYIDEHAFSYNTSNMQPTLKNVTIGSQVTGIHSDAFWPGNNWAHSIKQITINSRNVAEKSYSGTNDNFVHIFGDQFTTVSFGSNIKYIGDYILANCNNSGFTRITIPSSVETIGKGAFRTCNNLTTVTLSGNSIKNIDDLAFYNCAKLEKINANTTGNFNIPQTIKRIGIQTFSSCSKLINFSATYNSATSDSSLETIDSYAFCTCNNLDTVWTGKKLTTIGNYAFSSCSGLWKFNSNTAYKYDMPDSLQSIGDHAFYFCPNLKYVATSTSSTLKTIGNSAFEDCHYLTAFGPQNSSFVIPNSVETIGNRAFTSCTDISIATIGTGVKNFGLDVFANTVLHAINWKAINCESKLSSLLSPFYANRQNIGSCIFGNEVITIPAYLCYNFSHLEFNNINLPNSLTTIKNWAFAHCSYLGSVLYGSLSSLLNYIGNYAFYNDMALKVISDNIFETEGIFRLPNTVTTIASYAFSRCVGLQQFLGANNVVTLGDGAFAECSNLRKFRHSTDYVFDIPDTTERIGSECFAKNKQIKYLSIGSGIQQIGLNAFIECSNLLHATIDGSVNIGNSAFEKCGNLKYVVFNNVKSIGYEAFADCFQLSRTNPNESSVNFVIPSSCTTIGYHAFWRTSIKELTITGSSSHNTTVYEGAFSWCAYLETVTLGRGVVLTPWSESLSYVTSSDVFGLQVKKYIIKSSLTKYEIYGSNGPLENIEIIPDFQITMTEFVILGCHNLKTIRIGINVVGFDSRWIDGCENLLTITYDGTPTQWRLVSKASLSKPETINNVICSNSEAIDWYAS